MAVKASATITLNFVKDVQANYRYYLLQSSTANPPSVPTSFPPDEFTWKDHEPAYENGSTNTLYTVDATLYSDDTFSYSPVSISSSYEAAKEAYNKAVNVEDQMGNKVDKTHILASINASGETVKIQGSKIQLEGTVTANDYFKINTDGSMEAIRGKIGGWDIGANELSAINEDLCYFRPDALSVIDGYTTIGDRIEYRLAMLDAHDGLILEGNLRNFRTIIDDGTFKVENTADLTSSTIYSNGSTTNIRASESVSIGHEDDEHIVFKANEMFGETWNTTDKVLNSEDLYLQFKNGVATGKAVRFGGGIALGGGKGYISYDGNNNLIIRNTATDNIYTYNRIVNAYSPGGSEDYHIQFHAYNGTANTNTGLRAQRSDNGRNLLFGIEAGGVNAGIYDANLSSWLIMSDSTNYVAEVANGNSNIAFRKASNSSYSDFIEPSKNGTITLGTSNYRFALLYSKSAVNTSSDERLKRDIVSISELPVGFNSDGNNALEQLFFYLIPKIYYFKDDAQNKLHIGFVAQDIVKWLEDVGMSCDEVDFIDHDSWMDEETGEEKDEYSLRYAEFIALNTHMIQKQQKQINELQNEVDELKELVKQLLENKEG